MADRPTRVLYIDDDLALARLVQRALGRRGYDVVHAATGEDGIARIADGGFDTSSPSTISCRPAPVSMS